MAIERRDSDKQVEEIRGEANELETKVSLVHYEAPLNSWSQMAEHLKSSETELNQLLAEYWKLRHDTGMYMYSFQTISSSCGADLYLETLANKLNMRVLLD
jgi:kinetochore protein Nuf2